MTTNCSYLSEGENLEKLEKEENKKKEKSGKRGKGDENVNF